MSGGDAGQRIEIGALKSLTGRNWGSAMEYRLLRRQGEDWVQIGLYGSASLAGQAVDQAVGRGEGEPTDFRIEEVRVPESSTAKWAKRLVIGAIFFVGALALGMIAAMFLQ